MAKYQWAKWNQKRCKSKLNEKFLRYRGRCDLVKNHVGHHALERGLEIITFYTAHEVELTEYAESLVQNEIRNRGLTHG